MRRARWRRWLAVAILCVLLCVLLVWGWGALQRWLAARDPVQHVRATSVQIARGRYLAAAADCAACHTAPGGAPFAGGAALHTPFGVIHGTNITPDPRHGIGRYTAEEFFEAVTRGRARDGHRLYPAMPYASYAAMTREDSDAIRAFLMQQPAVAQANIDNDFVFPANVRQGLLFWQTLFGERAIPAVSRGQSPAWQRGRYLVDVLGHCGECHTPRGFSGQQSLERSLGGNALLGRYAAPDLRPEALAARGWDAGSLREYLATGASTHAVASDEMLTVVRLSTSRLSAADVSTMATYLLGEDPPAPLPLVMPQAPDANGARADYFALCAGCHGRDGEGVPNVAVRLHGNTSLRDADAHNLLVALLDGLPEHDFPGTARMQPMPDFAEDLDDVRMAALATWLRQRHGGQTPPVDAAQVRHLRANGTVQGGTP